MVSSPGYCRLMLVLEWSLGSPEMLSPSVVADCSRISRGFQREKTNSDEDQDLLVQPISIQ